MFCFVLKERMRSGELRALADWTSASGRFRAGCGVTAATAPGVPGRDLGLGAAHSPVEGDLDVAEHAPRFPPCPPGSPSHPRSLRPGPRAPWRPKAASGAAAESGPGPQSPSEKSANLPGAPGRRGPFPQTQGPARLGPAPLFLPHQGFFAPHQRGRGQGTH